MQRTRALWTVSCRASTSHPPPRTPTLVSLCSDVVGHARAAHVDGGELHRRDSSNLELEKLLLAKPELKTYLTAPAAIEIAVYNAMDDERFYSGRH